jgi:hypothetical protein
MIIKVSWTLTTLSIVPILATPPQTKRRKSITSCVPGSPTPLSILVRASSRCSVKGVVHSVVRNVQFLGNVLHGIAFIFQNKNRLTSFRRSLFLAILSL